jgi:hypothetical protein
MLRVIIAKVEGVVRQLLGDLQGDQSKALTNDN